MDQEPQQQGPSLALSDLVLLFNLVRIAAERGAIKADEMSAVGAVYEKLNSFLQASGAFKSPEEPPMANSADQ